MASAAAVLLAAAPQAMAQSAAQQPVQLQPVTPQQYAPAISTSEPDPQVSLGGGGTMYSDMMAARKAASVTPAAGDAAPVQGQKKIAQPPLTAPVTDVVPVVAPAAVPVVAHPAKTVGGAQMLPTQTIMANVVKSKDHTTLVKAIDNAGLENVLSGPGPFTVFAPTNKAFAKIPKNALAGLMRPESKEKLTKLLNYHVIAGTHDAAAILADIKTGGGKATYQTVAGSNLIATVVKGIVTLTDENGNVSHVTTPDVYQSNGVVHVVDTVVIPK